MADVALDSPSGYSGGVGCEAGAEYAEVTGEEVVYRTCGGAGLASSASYGGPVYRGAADAWAGANSVVDEEWKRSMPPMLQRQRAFQVTRS